MTTAVETDARLDSDTVHGLVGRDIRRWSVARPLRIGVRVKLTTRWRRGQCGTVEERLDDRIDGMARYGVRRTAGLGD